MYMNNTTFAKRYSRPAHCCRYSYKHRCLHMHINAPIHIFMHIHKRIAPPVYMHICPYMFIYTAGCISPPQPDVSAHNRLYQHRHGRLYCIGSPPAGSAPSCMHSKLFMKPAYDNEYAQADTNTNAHTRTNVYINMHIAQAVYPL